MAEPPTEQKPPQSWRDRYPVHPCCECFPMMDDVGMNKLAEDIKTNGLRELVLLHIDPQTHAQTVLDGRNRLEALTRAGIDFDHIPFPIFKMTDVVDVASLVISLNIRRRHLTKQQQAESIVKAVKAQQENDSAKLARSFSPSAGRRGGSTKDPVLEQAKTIAKHHGIS